MWSEGMRGFAGTGWVLVAMLVAGGCASVPRAEILAALPNTTEEQFLTLRWALIREAGAVRAVGERSRPSSSGTRRSRSRGWTVGASF
jgi:hypothetical protein